LSKTPSKVGRESLLDTFSSLEQGDQLELLQQFVSVMNQEKKEGIPLSIFDNNELSIFEAVVKYLHEDEGKKFSTIALQLQRNDRTIWSTYHNAKRKRKEPFTNLDFTLTVPLQVFSTRNFTLFESLVVYLKKLGWKNHKIAVKLRRDDRTIWTVYDRAWKKGGMHE